MLVATERKLPLAPLVEAWAADENGRQQQRLYRLAELLQAETPLPDALEQVRDVLADEEILAVRFGAQSGTLAASLRDLLAQPGPSAILLPRWRKALVYVFVVILVAIFIVSFLQMRIVPELNKIIQEFDLPTPPTLQRVVDFANFCATYWYVIALVVIVSCWLVFASWPGRRLRRALLAHIFRPIRALREADVMRQLGIAAEAGRPIAGAISTLARYHFDPVLRNQLLYVRNEIEQGADVWQSMGATGLLAPAEVRVLDASERVGNRPWALKQIAMLKQRQTARRLSRWSELALPLFVVLIGGFVLFQALGVFGPLISILQSLI
jgi:type IV pilus assembly protein PilC